MLVRCVKYTCMPQVFVRPSVCLSIWGTYLQQLGSDSQSAQDLPQGSTLGPSCGHPDR